MAMLDNLVRSAAAYPALAGVIAGEVPGHAFLIDARSLTVARHFARHLALGLACRAQGMRPCGLCDSCLRPSTPYVNELIPLGVEFRIQQIHALIEECRLAIEPGARRIYVVAGAEWMNDESANAFLKVLEEPPNAVAFLLATGSSRRVLPTIRSRCHALHVDFPPTEALLDGPLAASSVPAHWLYAALEVWGRSPGLLEASVAAAPAAQRPAPTLAQLLTHYDDRPAELMADPVEGLFSDLPHALESTAFFLATLGRVLDGPGVLPALAEAGQLLEWLDALKEGVEKGLTTLQSKRQKLYGPSYIHPMLEDDAYARSYYRRVSYQALEAYFRAALFLGRAALGVPASVVRLRRLGAIVPAVERALARGPAWAHAVTEAVEAARARLYSVVMPRFVLETFHLALLGRPAPLESDPGQPAWRT